MSVEEYRVGAPLKDAAAKPEEVTEIHLGTKLRDAAVDPRPEDHEPPVRGADGHPVSVQAVSPRNGKAPHVDGQPWDPDEAS